MNISPLDIRKQEFRRAFRGYNRDEVDAFLEMIAEELESLVRKSDSLQKQMNLSQNRLNGYIKIDRDLRDALIMMNKMKKSSKADAERKAEEIILSAKQESDKLMGSNRKEQQDLLMQVEQLRSDRRGLELKIRAMTSSMTRLIGLEEEADDGLSLDLEKLSKTGNEELLRDRMRLMQDVRQLQKEKLNYIARLRNLLEIQQKMVELD
ncbi:MAG: hypothetical protein B6244_09625 [Candidatus Cloacimonetes bacterium 4572_55]|nr:MAG: hypothetical protein B6244_09625 [Candidatus Cloacimonetes bacterium 4572_55]